jgi:hypothetical protein
MYACFNYRIIKILSSDSKELFLIINLSHVWVQSFDIGVEKAHKHRFFCRFCIGVFWMIEGYGRELISLLGPHIFR